MTDRCAEEDRALDGSCPPSDRLAVGADADICQEVESSGQYGCVRPLGHDGLHWEPFGGYFQR